MVSHTFRERECFKRECFKRWGQYKGTVAGPLIGH